MDMKTLLRTLLAVLLLAATPAFADRVTGEVDAVAGAMRAGRTLSTRFFAGETVAVWARFDPALREAMPAAALAAFHAQVSEQLGTERSMISETTGQQQDLAVYVRTSRWSRFEGEIVTQWAFDARGRVAGFFIRPAQAAQAAASAHLQRNTVAALRLPFDGEWRVYWGGRTLAENDHAADRGQRFAYDFVRLVGGRSHAGEGRDLADYHCWNQPILAPVDGRVVAAVGNLPDQAIGTTNARAPAGNHVVLDLGNDEFAFLAHFREGSLGVAQGDTVSTGQLLGRCGNSGNSTEPHLHMHLQDGPELGVGVGLPAQFLDYVADGVAVTRGEPARGQSVRHR